MSATISLRKSHAPLASVDAFDLAAFAGRGFVRALRALQPARVEMPAYAFRDAGLSAPVAFGIDWSDAEARRVRI
jgi:hypothetical protein